jgi:hypothetical protein
LESEKIRIIGRRYSGENMEIKGITDAVTVCDCCGKTNLKRTVIIDNDGQILHYGTSCAASYLKVPGRFTAKTAERLVAKYEEIKKKRLQFTQTVKRAQAMANDSGEAQHIVKVRSGNYSVRSESSNVGYRYIIPREVVTPCGAAL